MHSGLLVFCILLFFHFQYSTSRRPHAKEATASIYNNLMKTAENKLREGAKADDLDQASQEALTKLRQRHLKQASAAKPSPPKDEALPLTPEERIKAMRQRKRQKDRDEF